MYIHVIIYVMLNLGLKCNLAKFIRMTLYDSLLHVAILSLFLQYSELPMHYQLISVLIYIIMFLVELGRLYLAYEGNLREKVIIIACELHILASTSITTLYLKNQVSSDKRKKLQNLDSCFGLLTLISRMQHNLSLALLT